MQFFGRRRFSAGPPVSLAASAVAVYSSTASCTPLTSSPPAFGIVPAPAYVATALAKSLPPTQLMAAPMIGTEPDNTCNRLSEIWPVVALKRLMETVDPAVKFWIRLPWMIRFVLLVVEPWIAPAAAV